MNIKNTATAEAQDHKEINPKEVDESNKDIYRVFWVWLFGMLFVGLFTIGMVLFT